MKILVDSGLVNAVRDGAWMRYTLNQEKTNAILSFLTDITSKKEGADILPVTLVGGEVAKTKEYPTNEELSDWLGIQIKTNQSEKKGGCGCGPKGCC